MKNKYETFTYETEVIVEGKPYIVSGKLEATLVDEGIGEYEFWGSIGTDHYYVWELEDYDVDVIDETETTVEDEKLLRDIYEVFEEKAQSYLCEQDVD